MFKILNISSDKSIFNETSFVRERILKQGELFNELRIIIFTLDSLNLKKEQIAPNIWLYPTNSINRLFYILDAIKIGRGIENIDVVTCQDPFESGFVGWIISKSIGAKLHLQIHTDFLSPYFKRLSFLNKIRVFLAQFLLPKADGIRVVSERIKKSLKNYNLKNIPVVLPIYTSLTEFSEKQIDWRSQFPDLDFVILLVARLEKEKGVNLAIDAMEKVVKKFPHSGLVIVGEGSERANLIYKINSLGLEDNIYLLGWRDDVALMYKDANMCLVTSYYEGYGLVLTESALAGCPIISTDVGLVGDTLKDKEDILICPVGDVQCLSNKIEVAIKDKDLTDKMKQHARESTLDKMVDENEYLRLYKESLYKIIENKNNA